MGEPVDNLAEGPPRAARLLPRSIHQRGFKITYLPARRSILVTHEARPGEMAVWPLLDFLRELMLTPGLIKYIRDHAEVAEDDPDHEQV